MGRGISPGFVGRQIKRRQREEPGNVGESRLGETLEDFRFAKHAEKTPGVELAEFAEGAA
jgi:hypothetical protein